MTQSGDCDKFMASDFIHSILRSLRGTPGPQSTIRHPAVDNRMEQSVPIPQPDRRVDARFTVRTPCTYELIEERSHEPIVIPGKAYSLNVSSEGILLLLDREPQGRQLLAIQNPALQRQPAVTLFEVRWATSLPLGTTQKQYLVGCHLTFGRFPFFLVQRQHLDRHISGLSL
jgi:hypothetical protein